MRAISSAALAIAAFLLLHFCTATAQPITLRYGQIPSTIKTISALSFYIGQRKGFFAQEGIN
jgi:ABC-type nitrate/sulfonate/bicarbonate transport system substrate-binding protein